MSFPTCSRRSVLAGLTLSVVTPLRALAADDTVDTATLMAVPPLPDVWLGSDTAPMTVIEYASMTCTHCAAFDAESWPLLKRDYIDAGKVRYAFRDFPLDPLAAAGAMLARSRGPEHRQEIIDLLFSKQAEWAFVAKPLTALQAIVAQAGIGADAFEATLRDQTAYTAVMAGRELATKTLSITGTPTFFANGVRHKGEIKPDEMKAVFG